MTKIIIIRGPEGSGKRTLIEEMLEGRNVVQCGTNKGFPTASHHKRYIHYVCSKFTEKECNRILYLHKHNLGGIIVESEDDNCHLPFELDALSHVVFLSTGPTSTGFSTFKSLLTP